MASSSKELGIFFDLGCLEHVHWSVSIGSHKDTHPTVASGAFELTRSPGSRTVRGKHRVVETWRDSTGHQN